MIDLNLYIRQMGLCDPEKLDFPIGIIGAGGIGSWTTLALAKLGCQNLKVFDFDTVENHNSASQVYTSLDTGKSKVEALQERLIGLVETLPAVEIKKIEEGKLDFLKDFSIVISGVDNIDVRRWMFEGLKGTKVIFLDARMAGNALQVFTIPMDNKSSVAFYAKTLFPVEETEPIACSMRAVVYNVFMVASLITDIVSCIANNKVYPREIEVDLLNFKMYT